MKAYPLKLVPGDGYVPCESAEATHIRIHMPSRSATLALLGSR